MNPIHIYGRPPGGASAPSFLIANLSVGSGVQVELSAISRSLSDFRTDLPALTSSGIACVVIDTTFDEALALTRNIRDYPTLDRTRIYWAVESAPNDCATLLHELDVEAILRISNREVLKETFRQGRTAYQALGRHPLLPRNYLDASYNEIYDWFENTRWSWEDIRLEEIDRSLLTDHEVEILKEKAYIEFGTLPGAHNFLREWSDEYGFSSWALSWGAEEARHSLVMARYLRHLGFEVGAKHAMYKREPYPQGENQAATLMMNVISEARAAEYYRELARNVQEPVLKKIWQLLSRDESRHCRAFAFFCKELCSIDEENIVATLEMAYAFCADRGQGVRHPAGIFYSHSTSTDGLRRTEKALSDKGSDPTARADRRVFQVLREIVGEDIRGPRDIRSKLREFAA